MKSTFLLPRLTGLLVCAAGCQSLMAATIIPTGVTSSTTFAGRPATNTINGSGLTGGDGATGAHGTDANLTMWNTSQNDNAAAITFNLGGPYDVTSIRLWNFNESASLRGFGIKDVQIWAGNDASTLTVRGSFSFNNATGAAGYTPTDYDVSSLSLNNVGAVRFVVLTNQAGATFNAAGSSAGTVAGLDSRRIAGLSEIRFEGTAVPEPGAAMAFACLGTGMLFLRKRRQQQD